MKKNKKLLIRILVAFAIFLVGIVLYKLTPLKSFGEVAEKWSFGDYRFYLFVLPFLAAYLVAGYDVICKAGRNLLSGRLLDENFLMVVATFGAIALLDLPEACGVMLFYQVGELFQRYAVGKSRRSIAALMSIPFCSLISLTSASGSSATPLPSTLTTPGRHTPEGSRCRSNLPNWLIRVWPALAPP